MDQYQVTSGKPLVNRNLMVAGTILMGASAVLGAIGAGLVGAATAVGLRRHVNAAGLPPSELAIQHWRRAKAAAAAGASTWQGQALGQGDSQVPTPRPATRVADGLKLG